MIEPYYSRNGIVIYCGDCREVLPMMDGFNIVLTDPPFGVRGEDWDRMDSQEFARFTMGWLSEAKRIAPELVTFSSQEGPIRSLCESLYKRVRQLIWSKPLGSQYAGSSERKLWFSYEPIFHCYDPTSWSVVEPKALKLAHLIRDARVAAGLSRGAVDQVIRGKKTGLCYRWEEAACIPTEEQSTRLKALLGLNGAYAAAMAEACSQRDVTLEKMAEKAAEKADVFVYPTVGRGRHPCEKPLSLIGDLIGTLCEPSWSIIDPFMGSGTALHAAKNFGHRCVGIEFNERYCEIAAKRLEQEVLQFTD